MLRSPSALTSEGAPYPRLAVDRPVVFLSASRPLRLRSGPPAIRNASRTRRGTPRPVCSQPAQRHSPVLIPGPQRIRLCGPHLQRGRARWRASLPSQDGLPGCRSELAFHGRATGGLALVKKLGLQGLFPFWGPIGLLAAHLSVGLDCVFDPDLNVPDVTGRKKGPGVACSGTAPGVFAVGDQYRSLGFLYPRTHGRTTFPNTFPRCFCRRRRQKHRGCSDRFAGLFRRLRRRNKPAINGDVGWCVWFPGVETPGYGANRLRRIARMNGCWYVACWTRNHTVTSDFWIGGERREQNRTIETWCQPQLFDSPDVTMIFKGVRRDDAEFSWALASCEGDMINS